MNTAQIKARLAKLDNLDAQEIGCRVGELRSILTEYAAALLRLKGLSLEFDAVKQARDDYEHIAALKEANADANRIRNNALTQENADLRRALIKAQSEAAISQMCLATAMCHLNEFAERVGR